jgi:hypothetical protein
VESWTLIVSAVQTAAIIFGGVIAYIVYRKQKSDNIRNAAVLLRLEIDSIEKNISELQMSGDGDSVVRSNPIFQKLQWFDYRNLLTTTMDIEYVQHINNFYQTAIFFEEARSFYKDARISSLLEKAKAVQNEMCSIIQQNTLSAYPVYVRSSEHRENADGVLSVEEKGCLVSHTRMQLDTFMSLANEMSHTFLANTAITYYNKAKEAYKPISNTPAYDQLRKMA